MRAALERVLLALGFVAYYGGLRRLIMWFNRNSPKVLLYHACQPDEDDFIAGLDANTTPHVFAMHMAYIRRHYHIVTVSQLEDHRLPAYAMAVTFDDGYRSVYEHAFPVLRAHGVPATVYLVADAMDSGSLVWVNELNYYLHSRGVVVRPLAARALGVRAESAAGAFVDAARTGYDGAVVRRLLEDIRAAAGPDARPPASPYIGWTEVSEMSRHGVTFGSHTASHPNLARIPPDAQRREMADARRRLGERLGAPPTSLAYPFGTHDVHSAELAMDTGYRSVMLVGGSNSPLDLRAVARVPVTARHQWSLFAEIEVSAPVRGWLRRKLGG